MSVQEGKPIIDLVLEPGESSFHHGWVAHGSQPNPSDRRRCGITCIFAPGDIAYDGGDEETKKSMSSDTSATAAIAKTPWSEGHLVCGSAAGSQVLPLASPFPYIDPFESSSNAAKL